MRKGYKVNKNNTETHKQCPQCKEVLARSNFHISRSEHDGFSTYCKKCSVVKDASAYQKQKDKLQLKRLELKKKCVDLLGGKCSRCGYDEFLAGLDFHHINGKDLNVATLIARSARNTDSQLNRLFNEVEKCILLCRNCHNAYHAKQWN